MKTKEIINGSSRIEDETADDKETATKTAVMIGGEIISSMDYDKNNIAKIKRGGGGGGGNVDDIVYHRNNKNNKYNASMGKLNFDDYRYFGRTSMVDSDSYFISDQHYCNCGGGGGGRIGSNNKKKTWSTRSSVKNIPSTNFYEIDKLMYNEILEMENGIAVAAAAAAATSAVYATKKSLLLNEFLDLNDHHRSVQPYCVNDASTTFVNKFVTSATSNNGKCRATARKTGGASAASDTTSNLDVFAKLPSAETSTLANTVDGNAKSGVSLSSYSLSNITSGETGKGCEVSRTRSQSVCLTSSVLLSDKRLVGLFRSVALYWFFCLNTVLAKGDHVFKRKASPAVVSPLHGEINELLHRESLSSSSSSAENLQLKICCPDVVLAVGGVGCLDSDNFLWHLTVTDEAEGDGGLLSWAEHSKSKLFNDLFEKVLRDLADNCGIFTMATAGYCKASKTSKISPRFKNKFGKEDENRTLVESKAKACCSREGTDYQRASSKKSNRYEASVKNMVRVQRKYIIDVLDYYDDDDDDYDYDYDYDYGDEQREEIKTAAGRKRTLRAISTVKNQVIWKKRALKNKEKSKRKSRIVDGDEPVRRIIIEYCGGDDVGANAGAGCAKIGDYVIDDNCEEAVVDSREHTPPKKAGTIEDDEIFLDFDSYAEVLKRDVASTRQQRERERKQWKSSGRVAPAASQVEPPQIPKRVESSSTEDELSGIGSMGSFELVELAEPSSYFSSNHRLNSGTQKYAEFNMWGCPVRTALRDAIKEAAFTMPLSVLPKQTLEGAGSVYEHTKTWTATAPAPTPATFKQYRLWESCWKPEQDLLPHFTNARRRNISPRYSSMAKATGAGANVAPPQPARRPANFGKKPTPQSAYTLWGSPKIIDFLPGHDGGGGSSSSSASNGSIVGMNGVGSSYWSGDATAAASSSSLGDFSSLEYDYSSVESWEILNANAKNVRGPDSYHQHHFGVGTSKVPNLQPPVGEYVSFTDQGAFKYYKKPSPIARPTVDSLAVGSNRPLMDRSSKKVSEAAVEEVAVDANVDDYDMRYHFKPIQPAFKVRTDTLPKFERSESGTWWCNNKKLMTFKHELDDVSQPQRPVRHSTCNLDWFQAKFFVNGNDVACQTDWRELNGQASSSSSSFSSWSSSSFFGPSYEQKIGQDPSYLSDAAYFNAWDEVLHFLNKPCLGNIDVKAHLDLSCFF